MRVKAWSFSFLIALGYISGHSAHQFASYYSDLDMKTLSDVSTIEDTNCEPLYIYDEFPMSNVEITGSCLDYASCLQIGTPLGCCQLGTKACCLVTTSGGHVSVPVSYFINSDTPHDTQLVIKRQSDSFCQLKLSFGPFVLLGPDSEGHCIYESLTISGHDGADITICGMNTLQHMYLNFQNDNDIVLNMVLNSATSKWNIKIEQIMCSDTQRLAPAGCFQYYQGLGAPPSLLSFNYQTSPDFTNLATQQIANLDYTICFDDSYTGLVLLPTALVNISNIVNNIPTTYERISFTGNETLDLIDVPVFNSYCAGKDYLSIIRSSYGYVDCTGGLLASPYLVQGTADTFCGPTLPLFIYTSSQRIRVVTNNVEENDGDFNNLGFIIPYVRTNSTSLENVTGFTLDEVLQVLNNLLNTINGAIVGNFICKSF